MRSMPGVVGLAPEQHAAIHHDPFALVGRAVAVGVEIHADLAGAAERQEDEFVVCGMLPSAGGFPAFRRVARVNQ